jgi:hypothetical protein
MTMILDETTVGIWYCATIPGEQDFLLTLNRIAEQHYEITYRFRYYNSDDPFDEEDEKSWYSGETKGKNEEEVINAIQTIMQAVAADGFTKILRGDRPLEEFTEEFMEQDFVHAQKVH